MITKRFALQGLIGCIPIWLGCVDPVNLSVKSNELPFIIEGTVTDQPGPDTIKITQAFPVDGNYYTRVGIDSASVVISDNAGNTDVLTDIKRGYYVTDSLVGVVGRTYTLRGRIRKGPSFESTAELMAPAGAIDSIYYEYATAYNQQTKVQEDGFNVYVNSTVAPSSSRRMRWLFNGTYKLTTDPSLVGYIDPNCLDPVCPLIPLACSVGCECCTCFASEREDSPIVSDTRTVGSVNINRTFVHYIPINNYTFNDRYRVEIVQMEISQPVYDFYFDLKRQISNAASLFQPPFFELNGNVKALDGPVKIIGVFSAAAQTSKYIYIPKSAVPFELISESIPGDCRAVVDHSTTTVPPFWN